MFKITKKTVTDEVKNVIPKTNVNSISMISGKYNKAIKLISTPGKNDDDENNNKAEQHIDKICQRVCDGQHFPWKVYFFTISF
jgi:hypothetical protein